jgi:uncharacterized protein YdaU (DUF1376 family)
VGGNYRRFMSKPPGFILYPRDWLLSPSIRDMTDQQVRIYLDLLCLSWLEEPIATLPNDSRKLAWLLRLPLDEWEAIKTPIMAKFKVDRYDRLYNEKLKAEADKCANKSKAGKSGWTEMRRKKAARVALTLVAENEADASPAVDEADREAAVGLD